MHVRVGAVVDIIDQNLGDDLVWNHGTAFKAYAYNAPLDSPANLALIRLVTPPFNF
jgi:hypothetical protein